MTRTMYDGINSLAPGIAKAFPDAAMVAGYIDGLYAWSAADWSLFPRAEHVTITVKGGNADVADVENGDMTPGQTEAWIRERKAAGYYRPTIYCSRDTIPAVRQGTGAYVLGVDYDIWCADYTDAAHQVLAPGLGVSRYCAAVQYKSTAAWDISAVYDPGWPHRTPPAPSPHPTVEVNVQLPELRQGSAGQAVRNWQGLGLVAHGYGYLIAPLAGNVEEYAGVDGNFGGNTVKATRKFQEDRHLPQTGVVGAVEWTAALA